MVYALYGERTLYAFVWVIVAKLLSFILLALTCIIALFVTLSEAIRHGMSPTFWILLITGTIAAPILHHTMIEDQDVWQESVDIVTMYGVCPLLKIMEELFYLVDLIWRPVIYAYNLLMEQMNELIAGLNLMNRTRALWVALTDLLTATINVVASGSNLLSGGKSGSGEGMLDKNGPIAVWLKAFWRVIVLLKRLLLEIIRSLLAFMFDVIEGIPAALRIIDTVLDSIRKGLSFVFEWLDPVLTIVIKILSGIVDFLVEIIKVLARFFDVGIKVDFKIPSPINKRIRFPIPSPLAALKPLFDRLGVGKLNSLLNVFSVLERISSRIDSSVLDEIRRSVRELLDTRAMPGDTLISWVEVGRRQQQEITGTDSFDTDAATAERIATGTGATRDVSPPTKRLRAIGDLVYRSRSSWNGHIWFPVANDYGADTTPDEIKQERAFVRKKLRSRGLLGKREFRHSFLLTHPDSAVLDRQGVPLEGRTRARTYAWGYGAYTDAEVGQNPFIFLRYANSIRNVVRASHQALLACYLVNRPDICDTIREEVAASYGFPVWLSKRYGMYIDPRAQSDVSSSGRRDEEREASFGMGNMAYVCPTSGHYGGGSLSEAECVYFSAAADSTLAGSHIHGAGLKLDAEEIPPRSQILIGGAYAGRKHAREVGDESVNPQIEDTQRRRDDPNDPNYVSEQTLFEIAQRHGYGNLYILASRIARRHDEIMKLARQSRRDDDGGNADAANGGRKYDLRLWYIKFLRDFIGDDVVGLGRDAFLYFADIIEWLADRLFECPFTPSETNPIKSRSTSGIEDFYFPGCIIRWYIPPTFAPYDWVRAIQDWICPSINWPVQAPKTCKSLGFSDYADTVVFALERFLFNMFSLLQKRVIPVAGRLQKLTGVKFELVLLDYFDRFSGKLGNDSENMFCFWWTMPTVTLIIAAWIMVFGIAIQIVAPHLVNASRAAGEVAATRSIAQQRIDAVEDQISTVAAEVSRLATTPQSLPQPRLDALTTGGDVPVDGAGVGAPASAARAYATTDTTQSDTSGAWSAWLGLDSATSTKRRRGWVPENDDNVGTV